MHHTNVKQSETLQKIHISHAPATVRRQTVARPLSSDDQPLKYSETLYIRTGHPQMRGLEAAHTFRISLIERNNR